MIMPLHYRKLNVTYNVYTIGLFTSTTWPTHHVSNLLIESVNSNTYFSLVLRLSSNGQAQTSEALYINMFSNDINLMNFLLAALKLT